MRLGSVCSTAERPVVVSNSNSKQQQNLSTWCLAYPTKPTSTHMMIVATNCYAAQNPKCVAPRRIAVRMEVRRKHNRNMMSQPGCVEYAQATSTHMVTAPSKC